MPRLNSASSSASHAKPERQDSETAMNMAISFCTPKFLTKIEGGSSQPLSVVVGGLLSAVAGGIVPVVAGVPCTAAGDCYWQWLGDPF